MDIDCNTFPYMLPTIMKRIANSHFIAFDLELSGIPERRRRRQQNATGRVTLQERYADTKEAAEKYHILQIGLTCVEQDLEKGKYIVRPINFNLSPLVPEEMGIERNFTYSSGAVEFLLGHGYRMESPFDKGIPYLTRSETAYAEERAKARSDRAALPDIKLAKDDTKAIQFVNRARREIAEWRATRKPEAGYCLVAGKSEFNGSMVDCPLNRFERRLVHQLVRSDFPALGTSSVSECIQVYERDEVEEMRSRNETHLRLIDEISRRVGFRWVAEALVGGEWSNAHFAMFTRQIHGERMANDSKTFLKRLDELAAQTKQRRKVLVGHNCFLDCVYLYRAFYGNLPDSVEDFQDAIHAIFPLILDTKYIATAGSDPRFRNAQLWQIEEALKGQELPHLELVNDQPQYENDDHFHEAGFDSFVTAKVFLKLNAKMQAAASGSEGPQHDSGAAVRVEGWGNVDKTTQPKHGMNEPGQETPEQPSNTGGNMITDLPLKENEGNHDMSPVKVVKKTRKKSKASQSREIAKGKFFHSNVFESLNNASEDLAEASASSTAEPNAVLAENPASTANTIKPSALTSKETAKTDVQLTNAAKSLEFESDVEEIAKNGSGMLPDWDSEFWQTCGNKLRVYGTVEEMSDLTASRKKVADDATQGPEGRESREGKDSWWEWARSMFL